MVTACGNKGEVEENAAKTVTKTDESTKHVVDKDGQSLETDRKKSLSQQWKADDTRPRTRTRTPTHLRNQ